MRARIAGIAAIAIALVATPTGLAHQGDPNYESTVRAVRPTDAGLRVRVLGGDDRLELVNTSGRTVVVEGYDGEPYVRLRADRTVEVNRRSPAAYLNEDRFARVELPARADEDAPPEWERVDRSGRFEWHDHRVHWMSQRRPEKVEDESVRQTIFDWSVPLAVGGRDGEITGRLTWVPTPGGGLPAGAAIGLAALVVAAVGVVVLVPRRRRRTAKPEEEAW